MSSDQFDDSASALGYLYQVRLALAVALERLRTNPAGAVSIEKFDDVAFGEDGTPRELLQTKYKVRGVISLGDASPDVWSTIRIWSARMAEGTDALGADSPILFLITTGVASKESAAARLRPSDRDVAGALRIFERVAQTSTNEKTEKARSEFMRLDESARRQLVSRIVVIDGAPGIESLEDRIQAALSLSVERQFVPQLAELIEGWWMRQVVALLRSDTERWIQLGSVESKIDDLREQFRQDNLPIDDDIFAVAEFPSLAGRVFVSQLSLIEASTRRIYRALRDYYRAFEQRSKWLREDLLLGDEFERYERRLVEEWEVQFDAIHDELGDEATEQLKVELGQRLYRWLETQAAVPIRPNVSEPSICRGTYHLLADDRRVGWHPEFKERLEAILDSPVAVDE